jgi:DNA-binding NtrC family response regulator
MSSVVILEDDLDLRQVMGEIVRMLGADCVTVSSVADLQQKAGQVLASDLAILDVNLGIGLPNGIDAYNWLVLSGYTGRIVFLTGHASTHPLVAAAAKLHGVTVFEKPLDIHQFSRLLETGA